MEEQPRDAGAKATKSPNKKRGFTVSIDEGDIRSAVSVAKKVFKRKKKNRDLSSPRG